MQVPYACVDGRTLSLTITRPPPGTGGSGPWPAMLDLHGGAWTHFDPSVNFYWCRELAARGFLMASVEFRLAPAHRWPTFLEDVRAAARWLRRHGASLGADPARLGLGVIGGSTGGHLAAMLALSPTAGSAPTPALDTPDDAPAHVDWAVPLWPILDVSGRYELVRHTRGLRGPLRPSPPARPARPVHPAQLNAHTTTTRLRRLDALRRRWPALGDAVAATIQRANAAAAGTALARRLLYPALAAAHEHAFADVAAMEAASPVHLVERGLAQRLPPMLIVQGRRDANMTTAMTERFARAYRARGGAIDVRLRDGLGHSFGNVPSRAADELIADIARWGQDLPLQRAEIVPRI